MKKWRQRSCHVHNPHAIHGWKSGDVCSIPRAITWATGLWEGCPTSLDLYFLIYIMQGLHSIIKVTSMILLLFSPDKTIWHHESMTTMLLSSDKLTMDTQTYTACTHLIVPVSDELTGLSAQQNQRETEFQRGSNSHQHTRQYLLHILNLRLLILQVIFIVT